MLLTWKTAALVSLAPVVAVVTAKGGTGQGGDTQVYVDAARHLTGSSHVPPGLPLLLAPLAGSMGAMKTLMVGLTLALVTAIWWAAVRIGGWRSGVAASALMLLSPSLVRDGATVMADRPAALLLVAALLALLHDRPVLAGVLAGLSGWFRVVHAVFAAALPSRRAWLGAGVTLAVLAGWQVAVRGSLLGYSSEQASFGLEHVFGRSSLEVVGEWSPHTNFGFFLVRMFGLEPFVVQGWGAAFLAPFVVFPAVLGMLRHWNHAARFAALVVVLNLAIYLPYFFQSARFILPGGCLLVVYAAAAVGESRGTALGEAAASDPEAAAGAPDPPIGKSGIEPAGGRWTTRRVRRGWPPRRHRVRS